MRPRPAKIIAFLPPSPSHLNRNNHAAELKRQKYLSPDSPAVHDLRGRKIRALATSSLARSRICSLYDSSISKLFATPNKGFRRNGHMNIPIQDQAEIKELKPEKSFGSTESTETSDGTNISLKDPDTMLSMIVLLLTCLALATLAHVFV
jgi:hypothetical protein